MKIWFDLSNSPHINMFYDMIRELEGMGHEVIITCRPLANTIDLLQQKKLQYEVVGDHYGKNIFKKIFGYPIRVFQLVKYLSGKKIDIAVSQSSFHSPMVAKFLGIPSIYTNDNEHAMGNIPCFLLATEVLIPENLSIESIVKKGGSKKRIKQYPGVKEGIYLWKKGEQIHAQRAAAGVLPVKIYVRPEPLTAQYYKGGLNFLDNCLEQIQHNYEVIVLPRDQTQLQHYRQQKFAALRVPEKPLHFDQIAADCTLFIGAGGSMTRELAILGVPTISVYQDDLLEVDKFLLDQQLMVHEPNLTGEKVDALMQQLKTAKPSLSLMQKGKEAYYFLITEVVRIGQRKQRYNPSGAANHELEKTA
jgi:uncharacterized protein